MTYTIPPKYSNPACGECHELDEPKCHSCSEPCSHLVAYAAHEAAQAVIQESRGMSWAIRMNRQREALRGD